jgi:hypothetical protein
MIVEVFGSDGHAERRAEGVIVAVLDLPRHSCVIVGHIVRRTSSRSKKSDLYPNAYRKKILQRSLA